MGFQAGSPPCLPTLPGPQFACAATRAGRAGWHSESSVLPSTAVHIKKSLRKMTLQLPRNLSCAGLFHSESLVGHVGSKGEACSTPNEICMGKGLGQSVVHTLPAVATLVESKCSFPPPVFSAEFYASMIVGGSTETGLMAIAERLLLPKVVPMLF